MRDSEFDTLLDADDVWLVMCRQKESFVLFMFMMALALWVVCVCVSVWIYALLNFDLFYYVNGVGQTVLYENFEFR